MKYQKPRYLLPFVFVCFASLSVKAQTIAEKYDLNFRQIDRNDKLWLSSGFNCDFLIDSTNLDQNRRAFKLYYKPTVPNNKKMSFDWSKTILLPGGIPKKKCEVSIVSKDDIAHNLWFTVTGLDREERETSSKSITISSRLWKAKKISLLPGYVAALRIGIHYDGDSSANQNIWLGEIKIKVNGKDITNESYFSKNKKDSIEAIKGIVKEKMIPLAFGNDSTLLANIKELRNKRIIGLGECSHGSNTIKVASYQFIKNMIVNYNCKLVLLEIPVDATLILDMYVQGKIPNSYQKQIEADRKLSIGGYKNLVDFLNWLKAYNERSVTKVHLFGIDNPSDPQLYLFEYHLALLGKEGGKFYLRKTVERKYGDIIAFAQRDTMFQNRLGKQSFEFYLSILKNETAVMSNLVEWEKDRDINMSKRVNSLVNIFLKPGEKAAIYAHSGHLNSVEQFDDNLKKVTPLGFYLKNNYGNQYFSISFQIGEGTYTQDKSPHGQTMVDTLIKPPPYSFEYAGLATGSSYFYYRSKYLNDAILSYCSIARASRNENKFRFSCLKRRFDAYVFIKESTPIKEVELFPAFYAMDYFYLRRKEMQDIARELGN